MVSKAFKPAPGLPLGEETDATKSQSQDAEETQKSYQESLDILKGISANALSLIKRREQQMMDHLTSVLNSDIVTSMKRIGTARRASNHEPPVVPVRRVEAPVYSPQVAPVDLKACGGCGYTYKSLLDECPSCSSSRKVTEAVEYWRR